MDDGSAADTPGEHDPNVDSSEGDTEDVGNEQAFDLVRNELRISILQTLARAQAESPFDPSLRFSELRARLGNPDSGTFNYHLSRLQGHFVHQTTQGYELTPAGHRLVAAVEAGAYESGGTIEETTLDQSCPVCDEPVTISYDEGILSIRCDAGHGLMNLFPSGALENRSLPEIHSLFSQLTRQQADLALSGACPMCYAPMMRQLVDRSTYDAAGDAPTFVDAIGVEAQCDRCGAIVSVPVSLALSGHPVVQAMLTAAGHDPREQHVWAGDRILEWTVECDPDGTGPIRATVALDDEHAAFYVTNDWVVSVTETPDWLAWATDDASTS